MFENTVVTFALEKKIIKESDEVRIIKGSRGECMKDQC